MQHHCISSPETETSNINFKSKHAPSVVKARMAIFVTEKTLQLDSLNLKT